MYVNRRSRLCGVYRQGTTAASPLLQVLACRVGRCISLSLSTVGRA
jgi:hypothetical protein